ncbi:MAG: DUF86 domain-containing protein [Prevotellaceae bacterium]|jgi:uncharacterized protein with HEPN domain|nr:DUF86 domain-containing protein [Prevotellaceae bacterium]
MDEYIQKHLTDVLLSINEIESYFVKGEMIYENFAKDRLRQRAVERNIEIIGEAINRILKIDSTFLLSHSRAIVNTRNRVIHGYDSVTPEFLWGLIINHIPALKAEVELLLHK